VIAESIMFFTMLVLSSVAADPPGFLLWPKGVPAGGLNSKTQVPNHTLSVSHRDIDGLVEIYQKFDDVIVVQTGTAVLIEGGEVIEPASRRLARFGKVNPRRNETKRHFG
jgi:hypothetical protein